MATISSGILNVLLWFIFFGSSPVDASYCRYSHYYSYYYCYYYYEYYTVDGGVIAGVVIGALIGVALLVGFIIFICVCVCNAKGRTRGRVMTQPGVPTVATTMVSQQQYGQQQGLFTAGVPYPYQSTGYFAAYQTPSAPMPSSVAYPPPPPPGGPSSSDSGVPPPPVYAENVVNGLPPTGLPGKV